MQTEISELFSIAVLIRQKLNLHFIGLSISNQIYCRIFRDFGLYHNLVYSSDITTMVSAAKQRLNESRHAYSKRQSLITRNTPRRESMKIPKEYYQIAANYPLHLAAMHGDESALESLLDEGHDINKRDAEKRTPLMLAALFGRIGNVSYLLRRNASTTEKDIFGQIALHHAQECKCNHEKRTGIFKWHQYDLTNIKVECEVIVTRLNGNNKPHVCPSRPVAYADYFAFRASNKGI